jgi:hypothetical protein
MMPDATRVLSDISGPFRTTETCGFTKLKLCLKMGQHCREMNLDAIITMNARRTRSDLTVRPQPVVCRFESITSEGLTDGRS